MSATPRRSGGGLRAGVVAAALVASGLLASAADAGASAAGTPRMLPFAELGRPLARTLAPSPEGSITYDLCESRGGFPCYDPSQIRAAYGVNALTRIGDIGLGQTIVIVDAYGSPTIGADLDTFDANYGLPAPPTFQVVTPLGPTAFDESQPDEAGWAGETSLDVEWAHAIAPGAGIVLLTSPNDRSLASFATLDSYAVAHHLGQILSQSWGQRETLFSAGLRARFDAVYRRAAAAGITVLAAAGDNGSDNGGVHPSVNYPASSPWVTAVGGTSLRANGTTGSWKSERVWNDSSSGDGATGGGVSTLEREPSWQASLPADVQSELDGHRGLPDLAWNADPQTAVLVWASYSPSQTGWSPVGGTSEGAPAVAGLVADLNQNVGHRLGFLNPIIYRHQVAATSFHDITAGDNSYGGIAGFHATRGWDLASGWGTPRAAQLVRVLDPRR